MHFSLHRPIGPSAHRLGSLALRLAVLGLVALGPTVAQAQAYTPITNFAKNGNSQQILQKTFPSGSFTANNSFVTPFLITADGNGNNFEQLNNFGTTLTINVGLFGVSDVYTLLNAYSPVSGAQIATVEFVGSGGADQTFSLIAGNQIRDFYQGSFANTLNGTTSKNAYSVFGQGGAGTSNSSTGATGTYVVDEQAFHLAPAFASQTLNSIKIVNADSSRSATPLLLGVTAASSPVPEASTTVSLGLLLALGLGGLVVAGRRRRA